MCETGETMTSQAGPAPAFRELIIKSVLGGGLEGSEYKQVWKTPSLSALFVGFRPPTFI